MQPHMVVWVSVVIAYPLTKIAESQKLTLCTKTEEKQTCVIQCQTDSIKQTLVFFHPSKNEVGSCERMECRSNFSHYSLNQTTDSKGNEFFTKLIISSLNKTRDEGEWLCSYGNSSSQSQKLTVNEAEEIWLFWKFAPIVVYIGVLIITYAIYYCYKWCRYGTIECIGKAYNQNIRFMSKYFKGVLHCS